ncbi:hypothetical protein SADO_07697 [Salinisphaera dokdonensis CL-ES53]|uniref:DoxX protein n=1 Tax=Salinisphaera dokdonensis CL-ES53 TaxID=1304272 RepID=A0ABV2AZP0_9GAMM
MTSETRLRISLLLLRLGVFLVMAIWTIDKFVNPSHAAGIFEKFYAIPGVGSALVWGLAVLELALILAFVAGLKKRLTYGVIMVLHGVSTFSAFRQYFAPFEGSHLLFFAAWPMLAACIALYLLRDQDRLLTVSARS